MTLQHKDLLEAGVHFGHLTRKWHPNMAPFNFMERNGIHVIDLNKTLLQLQEAAHALKFMASAGKRILFVATKKQIKSVVEQEAKRLGMPYVTERWLGGTLTNFVTIRRLLKKMSSFDKLMKSAAYQNMAKKEQHMIAREKTKLERLLQGIADTTRLPAALFIVDINKEHVAVKEAQKLGIPVFALTDTNTDPTCVDYPIPSNDDASRSVALIVKALGNAIEEGIEERNKHQEAYTERQERAVNKGTRERNVEKVVSSEVITQDTLPAKDTAKAVTKTAEKVTTQQSVEGKKTAGVQKISPTAKAVSATTPAEKSKTNTRKKTKKEVSEQEKPEHQ